ncbi:MAG TPA: hypothetical protein VKY27_10570, partial [Bacteriovoracaceae bacterium]|nr:hypothetical protein [Bacteriovoracaceae bacterium]
MKIEFLTQEIQQIFPYLESISQDKEGFRTINNAFGYSGYKGDFQGEEAEISLAIILGGTGFILKRSFFNEGIKVNRFDHFNIEG